MLESGVAGQKNGRKVDGERIREGAHTKVEFYSQ